MSKGAAVPTLVILEGSPRRRVATGHGLRGVVMSETDGVWSDRRPVSR